MSAKAKYIALLVITILGIGIFLGVKYYMVWNRANVQNEGKLFIGSKATWTDLQDSIKPFIIHWDDFLEAAEKEKLSKHIRPGRYSIEKGWSNKELVRFLKLGAQDEIPIRVGNYNTVMHMAHRITPFLEMDSLALMEALAASTMTDDLETFQWQYFIMPNTYNFFWAVSPKDFVNQMEKVYTEFWTEERKEKAKAIGYTPYEVMTLASVVQLESYQEEEQPIVAGVYLNRLKTGMKLDADPTVIFAWAIANPEEAPLKRVFFKHLKVINPYNTYVYRGLPPGPICMPNPSAVEAVLNADTHDYYYFVADTEKAGYHIFAKTYQEHLVNAKKYRSTLN